MSFKTSLFVKPFLTALARATQNSNSLSQILDFLLQICPVLEEKSKVNVNPNHMQYSLQNFDVRNAKISLKANILGLKFKMLYKE